MRAVGGHYVAHLFKRLKHRLHLEAVTGLSWLTHQQDLAAKVLSDNLNALLCLGALHERDGQINIDTPSVLTTPTGALVKVNRTRAFAYVRQCLPRWLFHAVAPTVETLSSLFHQIAANVVHFCPGRSRPRPNQPKPHKAFAAKSVM